MKKYSVLISIVLCFIFISSMAVAAAESPKSIYAKFNKSVKAGDWKTVESYLTKAKRDEINKIDKVKKAQIYKIIQASAPISYKVQKEEIKGDKATLTLEGKAKSIFTGKVELAQGRVAFIKENGEWKIQEESWKSAE
ncbi:MAG: DUF4878 domain-containing protein [Candidatus Eremiobacteraeota bacterium]|nr:DUF4878 domain-containing protein [Candidatus Eremiobacteraeota bacterium]